MQNRELNGGEAAIPRTCVRKRSNDTEGQSGCRRTAIAGWRERETREGRFKQERRVSVRSEGARWGLGRTAKAGRQGGNSSDASVAPGAALHPFELRVSRVYGVFFVPSLSAPPYVSFLLPSPPSPRFSLSSPSAFRPTFHSTLRDSVQF